MTIYSLIPIILSALTGWLAWSGHLLPLAVVAPALIMQSPNRATATLSALAYYLSASSGVPHGSAVFFGPGSTMEGFALWLGAAAVNALPWAVLWHHESHLRTRSALALVILSIPPLGLVGWASPLTAAGSFFPGLGFIGLGLTLWLIFSVVDIDGRMIAMLLIGSLLAHHHYMAPSPAGQGIDTHFGGIASGTRDYFSEYRRNLAAIHLASRSRAQITVLPETVAGTWTSATASLWKSLATRSSGIIAIGAERLLPGSGYENGMVLMDKSGDGFFSQRVPVPVSMWRPWSRHGAKADWFGSGIAAFHGHRIGYLICYEQLLVWPALVTAANHPDFIVAMANDWWARGTSIPDIQRMAIDAWAHLFGWKSVDATNF